MHLEKAHWIIDNADLFIGEGTPTEEWCLIYKRLTRMSIGELTGESVRGDLMARYARFVRSIEKNYSILCAPREISLSRLITRTKIPPPPFDGEGGLDCLV